MLKQTLIALGVIAVAGTAAAADITNPFYLPTKGQVGSITSAEFSRYQYKNSHDLDDSAVRFYGTTVNEELQYGLTDSLALVANVGNTFEKFNDMYAKYSDKEDKNIAWEAGFAWNILNKAFKLQASLVYGQNQLTNRYSEGFGEYKYVEGTIKAGYQFDKMLPYVELGEQLPIGQKKGMDKPVYTGKVGLYQGQCETWGLDTGIRVTHDENTEYEATTYSAEAEASYYLTKKSAISVYGSYTFKGDAKTQADVYDKAAGIRLRWFF